jgi:DNA mismatch repair protein MutS2
VLEGIAARALSPLGRERLLALRPRTDLLLANAELARVQQLAVFLGRQTDWFPPGIPDARAGIDRLELDGSVLEPKELFDLGGLLESSRELLDGLGPSRKELPGLALLIERLFRDRGLETRIASVVERDGSVKDSASRELARIRQRLRRAHNRIVQALERYLQGLPERIVVPDASVTIRDGRYVIPVRREGRSEVGGVVLDESATGATLFVEPPLSFQLMSELRGLEREESREVLRILREQTEVLRPLAEVLAGAQEALAEFDSLYARATVALAWEAVAPELLPAASRELEIVGGRHPLLLAQPGEVVVPFDLELEAGERALVVSGPNTGGKSVFLKALGLIVTLAQSGVVPPVKAGTRFPLVNDVFADIGDEQSIAENLSTFSAHLGNLMEIVREAGPGSLVLIDEMGTGTDPQEGAALSRAIIEELVQRGTMTVVTSHLGALKKLDSVGSGIVNASLQFDPDRIQPTFQLLKGRPGRSYGLAIARRLGFPADVLDRAEGHLPEEEAHLEDLLAALELKEKEAADLLDSLSRERTEAARLRKELQLRETELEAREASAGDRAREDARQLLLDARREVEAAIREVRRVAADETADEEAMARVQKRARRRVEEAARRHGSIPRARASAREAADLSPGDRVRMTDSGAKGRVVEVREGKTLVESGGVRLQVSSAELEILDAADPQERVPTSAGAEASGWQGPTAEASPEADFRGLRVSEVDVDLQRALDQAVLAGLGELRIIHGKGTGALRQRVGEILEEDPRVRSFRLGQPGEGGAGVTIVTLR